MKKLEWTIVLEEKEIKCVNRNEQDIFYEVFQVFNRLQIKFLLNRRREEMKKYFGFMIIMSIVLFSINTFAFQNEPDGFRGVKWGTNIKALKDMKYFTGKGEFTMYRRNNDKMQIGGAKLARILYVFWNNGFSSCIVMTDLVKPRAVLRWSNRVFKQLECL